MVYYTREDLELTTNTNSNSTSKSNTVFGFAVVVAGLRSRSLGVHSVLNSMDPLAFQCPCHGVGTPAAALIRYRTFLTTINSVQQWRACGWGADERKNEKKEKRKYFHNEQKTCLIAFTCMITKEDK